jgi:sec-independent protein translocase protein TatB
MFDIGFWELALIGILALVVLGPKRLPEAARAAGYWVGRIRHFIMNAKQDLDREMQGGGLDELRRLKEELEQTRRYIEETTTRAGEAFNSQLSEIEQSTSNTIANRIEPAEKPVRKAKKKPARKKTSRKKSSGAKSTGRKTSKTSGASRKKRTTKTK